MALNNFDSEMTKGASSIRTDEIGNIDYSFLTGEKATDNPEEDAAMVERLYQEQHYYKYYLEREWYINHAFFHGKHWIAWNRVTNRVEELPRGKRGEKRTTINFIWAIATALHAKLAGYKMEPHVVPKTNSEEDRECARKSKKVLTWLLEDLKFNKKRRELMFNTILTGTSFFKLFLDVVPNELDYVPETDEQGNIKFNESGEPQLREEPKIKLGLDVVNAFDILVDNSGNDIDTIRWLIHVKTRTLDYIKQRYPDAYKNVKPDIDNRLAKDFEQRIKVLSDSEGVYYTSRTDLYSGKPTVTIKEYWEQPSEKWPRGRVITVANGILLKAIENPFGRIPFFPYYYVKNPMRFWGSTPITQSLPIQREYNSRRSTIHETILKMSKLKWFLPKNSGVADFALDTEVGEVVEYNPVAGAVPHQARMEPIPAYVLQDQSTLVSEFDRVIGQSELTRPTGMPKNVRTAGAAAMMQEMESLRMSPILDQHVESHEELMSEMLHFFQEFMKDRISEVTIYDHESDELESLTTSGRELMGNNNVIIQGGTEMPQSRSVKRMEILQLYQMGLLGPQNDDKTRKRVLRMLEFGDVAQVFADNAEEEKMIVDENEMMEAGEVPEVEEFHDHLLHIELHDKPLKSRGHKMDKQIKQRYLEHRRKHGAALEKLMQAMGASPQQQLANAKQAKASGKKGGPQAQGPIGSVAPQPSGVPSGMSNSGRL